MAKKAADAAIGAVKTELIWMANKHGRDLRLIHLANTTTDWPQLRRENQAPPPPRTEGLHLRSLLDDPI